MFYILEYGFPVPADAVMIRLSDLTVANLTDLLLLNVSRPITGMMSLSLLVARTTP